MNPSLDMALHQEIESVVALLDEARRSAEPAKWMAGLQACDRVLALIDQADATAKAQAAAAPTPEGASADAGAHKPAPNLAAARSTLWLKRGHLCEAAGTAEAAAQALECYGRAIASIDGLTGPGPTVGRAVAWMNRGNVLQRYRDEKAWLEAVRCYDQTVGWLGTLSDQGKVDAELAGMLGAAWMNRGSALRRFNKIEQWDDALKSFEQSLGLFQQLAAANPALTPNVVAAWGGRAEAKMALGEPAEAARSHSQALATLRAFSEKTGQQLEPWDYADINFQLGQALAQADDTEGALRELRVVLALIAADERDEVPAGILGLRARHAICVILGAQLTVAAKDAGELRAEVGDLAEDGLALAAVWKERGEEELIGGPGLGLRLFEFGAWLYRTQQPQFLAEFIGEHLGEVPGPRAQVAAQVLAQAKQEILQRPLPNLTSAEISRTQALIEGLRALETRLGVGTTARVAG